MKSNKIFYKVLFLILISFTNLYSNIPKELDKTLNNSKVLFSSFLYQYNISAMKVASKELLEYQPIKAIVIVDIVDDELIFSAYSTDNEYKNEEIPKVYKEYSQIEKVLEFNNHTLGKMIIYYQKNLLQFKTNKQTINLSKKEKDYLDKKKIIKMCVDPDWMPLEKLENGKYIGISSEYVKYFQQILNVPIVVVKTSTWSQSLKYVKNRKCDILPLALDTKSRREYLNFTKQYIQMPLAISTTIDKSFIYDFSTISNKQKIGIVSGYAYKELLKNKYPNLNIIEVISLDKGLQKVKSGELYGMIDIVSSIAYHIQKKYHTILKITGTFDENYGLSVGIRNDDLILLNIYNKAINNIDKQLHQEILNKWISVNYDKEINYTFIWKILFIVVFFILLVIYRQYLLNTTNKKLQKLVEIEVQKNKEKDRIVSTQSKYAAMGEMLSLITHQWRQPLNELGLVLQKFKYAYQRDKLTEELIIEQTKLGNDLVIKMSTTIDDFKNFLIPNKEDISFSLSSSIKGIIKLLNSSYKYNNINIIQEINTTRKISGSQGEFEQVILNILNNAKDALITKEIDQRVVLIQIYELNNNIIISIYDNAGGIKKMSLKKVFKSYFTTKKDGSGIGLYLSKEIINEHFRGELSVENSSFEVNHNRYFGACFKIKIPLLIKSI